MLNLNGNNKSIISNETSNNAIELLDKELDLIAGGYSDSPIIYSPPPPNPTSGVITNQTPPYGSAGGGTAINFNTPGNYTKRIPEG